MIKGNLQMAMDFRRNNQVETGKESYRIEGTWFVRSFGPTYCNIFRVTEFDAAGERWLVAHEVKPDGGKLPCAGDMKG